MEAGWRSPLGSFACPLNDGARLDSPCQLCDSSHAASHRCLDCAQSFCAVFAAGHRKANISKDHRVQPLPGAAASVALSSTPSPPLPLSPDAVCPTHGRAYEAYDQTCEQLMCVLCLLEDEHRPHKCVPLKVAATMARAFVERGSFELLKTGAQAETKKASEALQKIYAGEEKIVREHFAKVCV